MSGVALDVRQREEQPSGLTLGNVLGGYVFGAITLGLLYWPLYRLGFMPRPFWSLGPLGAGGVWSFAADLVGVALVVLVAAWWIWMFIPDKSRRPVSFGVVVVAVAGGYAPFLALRPAALSIVVTPAATTWIIHRYALGRTLAFPRPSWRIWMALALVAVAILGSYRIYHPLVGQRGGGDDLDSVFVELWNPGWADLTITSVRGGWVWAGWGTDRHRLRLPYTVPARSHVYVGAKHLSCFTHAVVEITFSVLGRTSSQDFTIPGYPAACWPS